MLLGEVSHGHELQQVGHQDEDVRALPDVVDVDARQQQVQQVDGPLGVGPHQGPGRRRQGLRKKTLQHKQLEKFTSTRKAASDKVLIKHGKEN